MSIDRTFSCTNSRCSTDKKAFVSGEGARRAGRRAGGCAYMHKQTSEHAVKQILDLSLPQVLFFLLFSLFAH